MKKISVFIEKLRIILSQVKPSVYASALSFHVTMTFFPLLICLYTFLGNNYDMLMRILKISEGILAKEILDLMYGFAQYVAENNSPAMMAAGMLILITSASASVRMIHWAVGKMQGGDRYRDTWEMVISFLFSAVLLAAIYFAVVVMFTGKDFIELVNRYLPYLEISIKWNVIRYFILGAIFFVLLIFLFATAKRRTDDYSILPGSIIAAVAVVLTCVFFSAIISQSSNYSLVYGSLASIILMMLWLYWCSYVIIYGAAINIAVRDTKAELLNMIIVEERKKNAREKRRS